MHEACVHVIVVPDDEDGLRRTFADVHRRYTGYINARHRWTGHLWQGRFGAVAMDEEHLANAVRYVSLNPVRARLVARAQDWRWSSVGAQLGLADDLLMETAPPPPPPLPTRLVNAGPIWNQAVAQVKCPVVAYAVDGRWTGGWKTVRNGEMSVCEIAR